VRVERIGEDDWAAFREIRLRSLLESPEAFGSTYGEESSQGERSWRDWAAGRWRGGTAAVFLARANDGRAIGTVTVASYDEEPSVAHVYAMWVAPDARRAGVGRALLDAAETWARDRGCDRLVLSVTESNDAARAFYEAHGFVTSGERRPLREGSDRLVVRMSRPLGSPPDVS
jgi:ribosomal protein S18 acetylase RimI-like enzyme